MIIRSPLRTERILLSSETLCLVRELLFVFSTSGSHQRCRERLSELDCSTALRAHQRLICLRRHEDPLR